MSRAQEKDADIIAFNIMNEAGYDPRAALSAIQKSISFRDKYGATTAFLSRHPNPEIRLSEVQNWRIVLEIRISQFALSLLRGLLN
jgi:predicted Zn-dependent protease